MRIRELEEKSGVPRTTIHFYLRHGLLHPPRKTGRTMAYYDETHLQRLKTISQLKKGGRLPLSLLKEKVEAADDAPKAAVNAYDVRKIVATTREKEKKRAEIIKQAIVVFTRKGYHGTKIVDITGALNISTGTFYLYFRNKRDLFIEVIDNVFRNIVGEAAVAIKDETDFFRRLRIRGRVFYENYTRYNEVLNQLRAEMAGDDHWPEEKIKKIYHGLTEPVRREIERAVKEGIIRPVDPDLAAYALTGLIEIMSLRISLDQKYNLDKIIDFIADLTLNGLLPMSRQSS
ncbi:MAG: MerR family transcriptional regulator [Desulfobacteraceae bacterium]|jgi:AcrR family transcriptional regulator|nr:MAG: MerR family transcriptional regulator [Desulfobacteraceae bacterium]